MALRDLDSRSGRDLRARCATSIALLSTACVIYFVVLGYLLPHIGHYDP